MHTATSVFTVSKSTIYKDGLVFQGIFVCLNVWETFNFFLSKRFSIYHRFTVVSLCILFNILRSWTGENCNVPSTFTAEIFWWVLTLVYFFIDRRSRGRCQGLIKIMLILLT